MLEQTGWVRYLAWMGVSVAREEDSAASRRLLEALTVRLPERFAQPDSNKRYAEQAEILESWSARLDGRTQGLLLLKRHSAEPYRRTRAFYERLGFELVLSREPLAYYLKHL